MFGATMIEELKVGEMAPDFSLKGSDGHTYQLADYRGKRAVVLAWFPRAFTPGCTTECRVLSERSAKLKKFDVAYFAVSVDPIDKNQKFAELVAADYPILSDPNGDIASEYGVVGSVQKWASRWTFFIDKDGKIMHIDKDVHPSTHADDIVAKLKELGVPER